jgi:hypothetical protein
VGVEPVVVSWLLSEAASASTFPAAALEGAHEGLQAHVA